MNESEKNILKMAFTLFVLGLVFQFLPWGIPSIDKEEDPINLESMVYVPKNSKKMEVDSLKIADKVTKSNNKKKKKENKIKKEVKKVKLPLHINQATVDDLCVLKGVGPKLAEKILDVREKNGGYSGPKDLEKVPGIGKKKLETLLQNVIFD